MIAIIYLEPGIPSNRISSVCDDYVPAPCTHRPSLLPIGWSGESFGLRLWSGQLGLAAGSYANPII